MTAPDWTAAAGADALRRAIEEHAEDLRHAGDAHVHGGDESVRTATHRGHHIEVRTSYRITVDGRPFAISASVDNAGRVHYHGLPTRDFASTVDLVKDAIDTFPDDFGDDAPPSGEPHEEPHDGPHGEPHGEPHGAGAHDHGAGHHGHEPDPHQDH